MPAPTESCDTQNEVSRLRLVTCQVSSTVTVRSSTAVPPSNWLSSRLRKNCTVATWSGAKVTPALAVTLWLP